MTEREAKLMEQIFNPYNEPLKQGEPTEVQEHWEAIEEQLNESKS